MVHGWRLHVEMKALLEAGLSKSAAAKRLGVNRRTVDRWRSSAARRGSRTPRAQKLDPYKGIIRARLAAYPERTSQRLFEEVREAGYPGSHSRVRDSVRGLRRAAPPPPARRFETPPGHQGQVDFGTFRTPWGRRHALVVVLGHSRLMWCEFYATQTMATVMTGLERAFRYFGGVPSELPFDRMKAVVTSDGRAVGGTRVLNEEFGRFAAHWGFRIRACRPFLNDADLNEQAQAWLRDRANARVSAALKASPRTRFERDERECLKPLARRAYRPGASSPEVPPVVRDVIVARRSLTEYAEMTR